MRAISLLALTALLAGCFTGAPTEDNPLFAAWFQNPTPIVYKDDPWGFVQYAVQNVQPKKAVRTPAGGTDYLGEAGIHEVCLEIDGAVAECGKFALLPGAIQTRTYRAAGLPLGSHTLIIKNASQSLEVVPMPHMGDWINGSMLDMRVRLENGSKPETTVHEVEIAFRNGTRPLTLFISDGANTEKVPWAPGISSFTFGESARSPKAIWGVRLTAYWNETDPFTDEWKYRWLKRSS